MNWELRWTNFQIEMSKHHIEMKILQIDLSKQSDRFYKTSYNNIYLNIIKEIYLIIKESTLLKDEFIGYKDLSKEIIFSQEREK